MDRADYRRASHAVWEAMAPGWDERHAYFEEVARPVAEKMLALIDPSPGDAILELAAGTGVVGFSAASLVGPNGLVIVSDFAGTMVEVASRRADELGLDNVECRVLDAERLDLPDESVDGVLCRWGYMLMADVAAALRETRRVLRADGRVACAVFAAPEQNPWAALPSRVLHQRAHIPPPEAGAPGIFALADHDRLRLVFTEAGFADPAIEEVAFGFRFAGMDDYWEYLNSAAGAIAMVLSQLGEDERERIRGEIAERVDAFEGSGQIRLPATSLVVLAS
ncbi:MAG TPA: methyltransferase domain-containing protein [Thermoleophilaceae bacterium]